MGKSILLQPYLRFEKQKNFPQPMIFFSVKPMNCSFDILILPLLQTGTKITSENSIQPGDPKIKNFLATFMIVRNNNC